MLCVGSGQWGQGWQRAQEPQTWPVSLQEGVEGPRPALHNPQKPAGPDQGGETRLSSGGPCAKGCGFLTKGEGVAVPRWAGAHWIWPQLDCPLQSHPSAWPFMEPVKKSEAPDYYEVIRFPIGKDPSFQLLPPTPAPSPGLPWPGSLSKACPSLLRPRPEDHDREAAQPLLRDPEALCGRPAACHRQLPRIQPPGQRVLPLRQRPGEVLLFQAQGGRAH